MKTIGITVATLAVTALAGSASAAPRHDTTHIIHDVLYGEVDAAISASTAPAEGIVIEAVTEIDPDDLVETGLTPVPAARNHEFEKLLTPKQRLHRMVQLLRSLPFYTVDEQVNDLLTTVYSLPI